MSTYNIPSIRFGNQHCACGNTNPMWGDTDQGGKVRMTVYSLDLDCYNRRRSTKNANTTTATLFGCHFVKAWQYLQYKRHALSNKRGIHSMRWQNTTHNIKCYWYLYYFLLLLLFTIFDKAVEQTPSLKDVWMMCL